MSDWAEPYNRFDSTVILLAYGSAIVFGYGTKFLGNSRPVATHALLVGLVVISLLFMSWRLSIDLLELPLTLVNRVYDGTQKRLLLLLFWAMNVFSSVAFCARTALYTTHVTTSHRKFFHLTISLVAVSGFWYDAAFVVLCGNLMVVAFIIIEILRIRRVPPWCTSLDRHMLPFLDAQDHRNLILTPIHLIGGVFLPSLLDRLVARARPLRPPYHAGVLAVGVGDACAALVGSRYGAHPWGVALRKSAEGSVAMFAGQVLAHALLFGLGDLSVPVLLVYAVTTVMEAALDRADNLLLPVMGYALLKLRECFL